MGNNAASPEGASVRSFGARGDATADDAAAIQRALDSDRRDVWIPQGTYLVGRTLRMNSGTRLRADPGAVIRLADGAGRDSSCFLLTNRNHATGDTDVTVEGGVWDGNAGPNPRGHDGNMNAYTGVAINFVNVCNLALRGMKVRDPESFFIRVGEVRQFTIEDIALSVTVVRPNQDGIHVGGLSENGLIRNIRATGRCTNDDMIAINADDDVERAINLGMKCGPIRNVRVEDIQAEDANTFLRVLSRGSLAENIVARNVRGGCRYYAMVLERWRFPRGAGNIRACRIEGLRVHRTSDNTVPALILVTLGVEDVTIADFERDMDDCPSVPSLLIENDTPNEVVVEGLNAIQLSESRSECRACAIESPECAGDGRCRMKVTMQRTGRFMLRHGGWSALTLKRLHGE